MGVQDLSSDQVIELAVFPSTTEPKNIFAEILNYAFAALVRMQVVAKGKFSIRNTARVSHLSFGYYCCPVVLDSSFSKAAGRAEESPS